MPLDPQRLLGLSIPTRQVAYSERDVMLYGLAVGLGDEALPFVYERDLRVVPSFASTLAFDDAWLEAGGIDLRQVVHGALDLRFTTPLAPSGTVDVALRIAGVVDKGAGRGGLAVQETTLAQGGGTACTILSTLFVRGAGGFGGSVGLEPTVDPVPEGDCDQTITIPIAANQALLFRLLGDRNPLHADPEVATASGFARPILHGASTFGTVCAALLQPYCGGDPARLTRFAARFAGPLYPGETLEISCWEGGGGVAFRAVARERGAIVLDNGAAEIRS